MSGRFARMHQVVSTRIFADSAAPGERIVLHATDVHNI